MGLFDNLNFLFDDEQPMAPKPSLNFPTTGVQRGAAPVAGDYDPLDMGGLQAELDRINEETRAKIDALRDQGPLARYPVIQTDEDRERERARLKRRGLDDAEIDRRIAKFEKKGGKVKTSAKLLKAASMLSDGIKGYLTVKGFRTPQNAGIADELLARSQAQIDQQVADIQRAGEQEQALLLQKDEREFQTWVEDLRRDNKAWTDLVDRGQKLGLDITTEMDKADAAKMVTDEIARRAKREEELEDKKEERLKKSADIADASRVFRTHAMSGSLHGLDDRTLALAAGVDPNDQKSIDTARAFLEGGIKRASSIKDVDQLLDQLRLQERQREALTPPPPKETPEQKFQREQQEKILAEQAAALRSYEAEFAGAMTHIGNKIVEATLNPQDKELQSMVEMVKANYVSKLVAGGYSRADAVKKVDQDFSDAAEMAATQNQ